MGGAGRELSPTGVEHLRRWARSSRRDRAVHWRVMGQPVPGALTYRASPASTAHWRIEKSRLREPGADQSQFIREPSNSKALPFVGGHHVHAAGMSFLRSRPRAEAQGAYFDHPPETIALAALNGKALPCAAMSLL